MDNDETKDTITIILLSFFAVVTLVLLIYQVILTAFATSEISKLNLLLSIIISLENI